MIDSHKNAIENKNIEDLPKSAFSQDQLVKAWKEFAYIMKKEGKESLFAMLVNSDPILEGDLDITFTITNTLQSVNLEKIKSDLLAYVRKQLNNWSIRFTYTVDEGNEDVKENLYSSKDRFKKMSEKNPTLLKMQKLFNLDIDF